MSVSVYSLFMAFLWSNIFIVVGAVLQRRNPVILCMQLGSLLFILALSIVRLFVSIEFPFVTVIRSKTIYPAILDFFNFPLFVWGDLTIYVYTAVGLVWALGIIIFLGKMTLDYIGFKKYMSCQQETTDIRVHSIMDEIIASSKPNAKVKIIQTAYADTPMFTGFFKPTIYLPDIQFSDSELKLVLQHEWAHYIHKDLWIKLFLNIACSLYWWNPLMHLFQKDADHLLELKSDLFLVKRLDQKTRTQYLETILMVAENVACKDHTKIAHAGVGFVGSNNNRKIKQRFQLIDSYKPSGLLHKLVNLCTCTFFLAMFAVSFLFILQPGGYPPGVYDGTLILHDEATAYLTDNKDGSYSFYSGGVYVGQVFNINAEPFSSLPIK